jgi:hypothetical protein
VLKYRNILINQAKVIAAKKYQQAKQANKNKKLQSGELATIIKQSVISVGLPEEYVFSINKGTIKNRVLRNNIKGMAGSFSQSSPMAAIEPMLAEFCRLLNRMAKSITQQEFLELANDIIVETPTSDRVREFQQRICGVDNKSGQQRLGKNIFTTSCRVTAIFFTQQKLTKKI